MASPPKPQFQFFDVPETVAEHPDPSGAAEMLPMDLRSARVEEFFRSRELSANTRKAYTRELQRWMQWTDKPWHQVTARDVDRFKAYLHEQRSEQGQPLSAATIRRALATVQSFFKWLTAKDYITKNPTLSLEPPKLDPIQSKELTASEVAALHGALGDRGATEARDRAILAVLEHGLRASEVAALNIQDYDGVRLHIRKAKAGSVGTVPLVAQARRAIDAYLGERVRMGLPVNSEAPLFLSTSNNRKGQRLSYWGIYKLMAELAQQAGVEGCHPHRLRHTFATKLVLKQMDSVLARKLTRHQSESSFERYSQRAIEIEAEHRFFEVMGEPHPDQEG